ncbi:MAG: GTPase Era [Pseudomonadota bacterium]
MDDSDEANAGMSQDAGGADAPDEPDPSDDLEPCNDAHDLGSRDLVSDGDRRCGFVAIIGATNAGKSTLVNALVGAKVTIVSRKVQTTRTTIRGISIIGPSQLVLIDTPGIFEPKRRLDRAMIEAAWSGAADADIVALLVDAQKGKTDDEDRILKSMRPGRLKTLLVLNKVDRLEDKAQLLALIQAFSNERSFDEIFMVSATTGDGVTEFADYMAANVPPGPWHYPEDDISDLPMRLLAAELLREKIYDRLHQELPYATTVETSEWRDLGRKGVRIEQTIFVERASQRGIVLGKGGQTMKAMAMEARQELSEMLERPVHLFTFVKVRENWAEDPERYREMGLTRPLD